MHSYCAKSHCNVCSTSGSFCASPLRSDCREEKILQWTCSRLWWGWIYRPKKKISKTKTSKSYFLHWNFDKKSCFVVFFHEWNEWKNPQFNFSSQNLSLERNFFKWDGKVTKIWRLLFHRIWKKMFMKIKWIFFCRMWF